MDQAELWERFQQYLIPGELLSLDISRVRFPDDHFSKLHSKLCLALNEMDELESGAIANRDENRMVGHYWLRAPELSPSAEIKDGIEEALRKIKSFASKVHSGEIKPPTRKRFTRVLVIGIGGSALGPQLVSDALGTAQDPMKSYFLDNTDPDGMARVFEDLGGDIAETLSIVISKSGGTVETQNGLAETIAAYDRSGLTFSMHSIAITQPGSALDRRAEERKWLARFPIWDWVGGRTSLFSSVGLIPAALQGVKIDELLSGARIMDQVTRSKEVLQNPALVLASIWYHVGEGRGAKDMVVLPYKDRLVLFSKYLQQLVMESLGKELDREGKVVHQGLAVYGNKGSTDQHAYVQQLRDGIPNFFATFIEVLDDGEIKRRPLEVKPGVTSGDYLNGFFQGTRRALFENGRDSVTITLESLNTKSLGALIALFERAVGFYASLINVNAYHQPGVEAGKKAAEQIIAIQQAILNLFGEKPGEWFKSETLAAVISESISDVDIESVYRILRHLSANSVRGVYRKAGSCPRDDEYSFNP